jgi:hypothetical protein
LHDGLEDTPVYLEKTKNALQNLLALTKIFDEKIVRDKVNLFNLYFWQRELGLNKFISPILRKAHYQKLKLTFGPAILQFLISTFTVCII